MPHTHLPLSEPRERYLSASPLIDIDHPAVQATIARLRAGTNDDDDIERATRAFHFVRDEIPHSWDIQSHDVSRSASDVLANGTGICYAKSHLLAALLRGMALPAGICYQRLVLFEDPKDGYSLHALNAVYLPSQDRWIRIDARGNKPGVDAQFSLTDERLAFAIRPELGEIDYPGIHAEPVPVIVRTLEANEDCVEMYRRGLPSDL